MQQYSLYNVNEISFIFRLGNGVIRASQGLQVLVIPPSLERSIINHVGPMHK
jgi:hypothetical protein